MRNCLVCGSAMYGNYGSDAEGLPYADFCAHCYRGGQFYHQDWEGSLGGMPLSLTLTGNPYYMGSVGGGFFI